MLSTLFVKQNTETPHEFPILVADGHQK